MDFSFPKKEKLTSKKKFQQLFETGKQVTAFPLLMYYLPIEKSNGPKFKVAVVAPKKHFKSAVQRNRVKRLLRENYRLNKPLIFNNTEGQYALVILYLGKEMPTFSLISSKILSLFKKFLKTISDENSI
ncbi:MAG: ribonuclease P protein component [Bacteroidota bacterium]